MTDLRLLMQSTGIKQQKKFRLKHLLSLDCVFSYLASRKRERRIITASHVLCFSCIWMVLNLPWIMFTMRSISFGEIGLVLLCSLSRFITWVVNSLQAWKYTHLYRQTIIYPRIQAPTRIYIYIQKTLEEFPCFSFTLFTLKKRQQR